MKDKLTFGDLKPWDAFIALPVEGDNEGHGGFKGGHNLFAKIDVEESETGIDNSYSIYGTSYSSMPDSMLVIKVNVFHYTDTMQQFIYNSKLGE
jgi:hypothetical protein